MRLTQAVFDQAARYNRAFQVRWLLVTNGHTHYCCEVDHAQGSVRLLIGCPIARSVRLSIGLILGHVAYRTPVRGPAGLCRSPPVPRLLMAWVSSSRPS